MPTACRDRPVGDALLASGQLAAYADWPGRLNGFREERADDPKLALASVHRASAGPPAHRFQTRQGQKRALISTDRREAAGR